MVDVLDNLLPDVSKALGGVRLKGELMVEGDVGIEHLLYLPYKCVVAYGRDKSQLNKFEGREIESVRVRIWSSTVQLKSEKPLQNTSIIFAG